MEGEQRASSFQKSMQSWMTYALNHNFINEVATTMDEREAFWVLCPTCKGKTRVKIFQDTTLKKFPLFCPKCKRESLIDIKDGQLTIHNPLQNTPDA